MPQVLWVVGECPVIYIHIYDLEETFISNKQDLVYTGEIKGLSILISVG